MQSFMSYSKTATPEEELCRRGRPEGFVGLRGPSARIHGPRRFR